MSTHRNRRGLAYTCEMCHKAVLGILQQQGRRGMLLNT